MHEHIQICMHVCIDVCMDVCLFYRGHLDKKNLASYRASQSLPPQRGAVCRSVVQCVAVWCSVLQYCAVSCSEIKCVAEPANRCHLIQGGEDP